ncbi:MAG: LamG domain-containing protein [Gammaproteobacteria bacterium]|nr:LamG domain-containing protein [Gammaproteobacteria bacterium]
MSYANTSLLLPMSGADNGTVFTDLSPVPKTITRYGDAKTVTAESKYYGSSAYFDGSGDALEVVWPFAYGASDFTVEFWIRLTSSALAVFFDSRNAVSEGPQLVIWNGGVSKFHVYVSGSNKIIAPAAYSINTWYHVAVSRASGTTRLFVNGVQKGSFADTFVYTDARANIGSDRGRSALFMAGYLQDLRIVKGEALYTDDFTPPGPLASTISGIITDQSSSPVQRTVVAVPRNYLARTFQSESDPSTGAYAIAVPAQEEYSRIVLSTSSDPLYNDIIDRVLVP